MMRYAAGDEKQSIDTSMKRLLYKWLLNRTITTLTSSILNSADGAIDGVNEDKLNMKKLLTTVNKYCNNILVKGVLRDGILPLGQLALALTLLNNNEHTMYNMETINYIDTIDIRNYEVEDDIRDRYVLVGQLNQLLK